MEFGAKYLRQMNAMSMLHDRVMSKAAQRVAQSAAERRGSDRLPFPAEMVLVWNHDLGTPMRYRVLDAGDGGYRIHSTFNMLEGTTAMVLRLLPGRGQQLDQPVMVAWSRATADGEYEIGLRCF